MSEKHPLVATVRPQLAAELTRRLAEVGEDDLAAQVPTLRIVELCHCGECGSFYTLDRPRSLGEIYGTTARTVVLESERVFAVGVIDGDIDFIEVI